MKQKILVSIFVFTIMLTLPACGSSADSSPTTAPAPVMDEGSSEANPAELAGGFSQDEELAEDALAENTADDDIVIGNSGMSYFKLGFSLEDFTFAGYSLTDGNHYEEALQVVSENYRARYENGVGVEYNDEGLVICCNDRGITADPDFTGWTYWNPYWNLKDAIYMKYTVNGSDSVNRVVYEAEGMTLEITADIDNILPEYPFVDGPVMVGMDYDDVISILRLEKIIEYTMEDRRWRDDGDGYYSAGFESQYGAVTCMYHPISEYDAYQRAWVHITSNTDNEIQFMFWFGFSDNVLTNISYGLY